MTTSDGTGPLSFDTTDGLDSRLTVPPAPHPGLWVRVARKGPGIPSVSAADVNGVALCHGWITGQRKGLDETYYLQRITPRRPGGLWSMVNASGSRS
ncbi:YdeI family protein [Streptomyces sp. NPDC057424]|uniref:YdeI/OmpD-associated family protein n=1 Tax=Streptomyces sp. NPDC057424 TaxID=3346127 RepID=UPI0036A77493